MKHKPSITIYLEDGKIDSWYINIDSDVTGYIHTKGKQVKDIQCYVGLDGLINRIIVEELNGDLHEYIGMTYKASNLKHIVL